MWRCLLDSVATGSQKLALGAASGALGVSSKGLRRLRCGVSFLDSVATGGHSLVLGAASEALGLSSKGLRRLRCGVSPLDPVKTGSQGLALGAASDVLGLSSKGLRRFRCGASVRGADARAVVENLPAECFPDQPIRSERLKAGRPLRGSVVLPAFGRSTGRDVCNVGQLPKLRPPRRC